MADKNLGNLYYSLGLDDTEFNKKMSAALQKYEDGLKKSTPSLSMTPIIQTYQKVERVSTSAAKRMRETMEENIPALRKMDDRLIQLNKYYRELERNSEKAAAAQAKVASKQATGQFKEYIKSLTSTSDEQKAMSAYYRELERNSAAIDRYVKQTRKISPAQKI